MAKRLLQKTFFLFSVKNLSYKPASLIIGRPHNFNFSSSSLCKCPLIKISSTIRVQQYSSQSHNNKNQQIKWEEEEDEILEEPKGDTPYVVYNGPLKKQLKHIKIFSLMTTIGGLPLQPMVYSQTPEHGIAATIALLSMIGFFTYVTPFLIHQMAKKYVTEIIYDPKTQLYTAVTYSFFLQRKEVFCIAFQY